MQRFQRLAIEEDITIRSQLFSMLAYLGVLCLIPLLLNRHDDYVSFHTRQGLAIWLTEVVAAIALYVPGIGRFFFTSSITVCMLFSFLGILSVFLEKAWSFPFFGQVAARL